MYYIVWQFIIECTVCKKKKCNLSHSVLLMFYTASKLFEKQGHTTFKIYEGPC